MPVLTYPLLTKKTMLGERCCCWQGFWLQVMVCALALSIVSNLRLCAHEHHQAPKLDTWKCGKLDIAIPYYRPRSPQCNPLNLPNSMIDKGEHVDGIYFVPRTSPLLFADTFSPLLSSLLILHVHFFIYRNLCFVQSVTHLPIPLKPSFSFMLHFYLYPKAIW